MLFCAFRAIGPAGFDFGFDETAMGSIGSNLQMRSFLRSVFAASIIASAVLAFSIGVLASNLPDAVGGPDISDSRDLRLPAARSLYLLNEDGAVQIYTHDFDEITVQASIKAYNRGSVEESVLQGFVRSLVTVNALADTLRIVTEPDERPDNVDLRVDYVINIPVGTDVNIEGSNGNVWVSKGCGDVSVRGRNTDIEITEPRGVVEAQSTNGRIRVFDAPEGAQVRTVNGNIYAHILGGTLNAATTNGAIVARVLDSDVVECSLSSQNGGITILMNDDCTATVDAVTDRGVVKSELPIDVTAGLQKSRHLKGTIGSGHTMLKMDTLNGNIWIKKGGSV
jgi:hypothetical protein